jgi:hypothetical protein
VPLDFDWSKMLGGAGSMAGGMAGPQQNSFWQNYQAPQMQQSPQFGMGGSMRAPMMGGINPSMGALQGMMGGMNPGIGQMQNFGNLMNRNQNTGIAGPGIGFGQPSQTSFGIGPSQRKMFGA